MPLKGTVSMVGLPDSGKTTFLAALWHQLESAEIPTAFTAARLQPDREYLNAIRETWLAFEEIAHTSAAAGVDTSALLHLRHSATEAEFDLSIPDIAGEAFRREWVERQLPKSYVEQLQTSLGIMLFVHCRQVATAPVLSRRAISESSIPSSQMVEWEPKHAPTQVRLIDLLQSASAVSTRPTLGRVAVIVSAWDEVEESITPRLWLEQKLPLFDQFLLANRETIASEIYGVSAIGGSLKDRDSLAAISSPSARVRIHVGSETFRDLTLPLEFLTLGAGMS